MAGNTRKLAYRGLAALQSDLAVSRLSVGQVVIMKAVARISFDRNYFETFYSNWLAYRSRWRRYAIPFAIAFLIDDEFHSVIQRFYGARNESMSDA